jgi:hypothetical protein
MHEMQEAINDNFEWIYKDDTENGKQGSKWDSFVHWLRAGTSIYWISGKAGSGKSTLMRFLVQNKKTQQLLQESNPGTIIISAYIWNAGSAMQRSLRGLLSALLYDLFEKDPTLRNKFYHSGNYQRKYTATDWSSSDLEEFFLDSLRTTTRTVCIFIDGLDEIDRAGADEAVGLMSLINTWAALNDIKLCISSRPEQPFEGKFRAYPRLRVQDLTEHDIQKYTHESINGILQQDNEAPSQLSSLPSTTSDLEHNSSRLVDHIVARANGVFLWVCLVVSSIRKGLFESDDWDTLITLINDLPGDLSELYETMWKRANGECKRRRTQAAAYLRLLLFATNATWMDLVMASNQSSLDSFYRGGTSLAEADLYHNFRTSCHPVVARCGGLVEFPNSAKVDECTTTNQEHATSQLSRFSRDLNDCTPEFIHRAQETSW